MNRGYVKFYRKCLDGALLRNAHLWQFMSWCLFKASHKTYKHPVGTTIVELQPGQFVFGRAAAGRELNTTERKIRTLLETLKNIDFLTIKTTNKYSIITIVNWHIYQDERPANDQQNDQLATSKRPANDHKQTQSIKHKKKENTKSIFAPNPSGFRAESGTLVCDKVLAKERTVKSDPPPRDDLTAYYLPVKSPNMGEVAYLKAENWKTWAETYGEEFCMICLKAAYAWALSNPAKAKTVAGIHTFFNSWLKKEQDKGGVVAARASPGIVPQTYAQAQDFERRQRAERLYREKYGKLKNNQGGVGHAVPALAAAGAGNGACFDCVGVGGDIRPPDG